ncbi:MAG TPA: hypothetical protein PJ991_02190 [Kiritimatiellia bacterium]|nr:hypothetical protein [Kiritimatiellia bacterium]
MSEDKVNPVPEEPTEIVKAPTNKVEVSADLLNEAVTQLRKLTELRQRESERQERAIAQMHSAIKRQGILSRYVIFTSLLVVIIAAGLAYMMRKSVQNEQVTVEKLSVVDERLAATAQTIAEETQRQVSTLDSVRTEVLSTRDEQSRTAKAIEQELQSTRASQAAVVQKVEEQLGAVRQERDEVRGEVRSVLEEKTRQFTEREIQLRAEREAIAEAKRRSREEQKELIQQTIERLSAMTATLDDPAEAGPTDEEIAEAIKSAEAIETGIQEEAVAEEPPAAETP